VNNTKETFAKRPLLPNFCVRLNILHEVKLKLYPQNTQCIPEVNPPKFGGGFAFLELEQN